MVSDEEMDPLDLALIAGNAALVAGSDILKYSACFINIAKHTSSLSGHQWCNELLARHDNWFYNEFGMCKHVFEQLLLVLCRDAHLIRSWHVTEVEQLCVFLHYVWRGLSNRALQEQFQWSRDMLPEAPVLHWLYQSTKWDTSSSACLPRSSPKVSEQEGTNLSECACCVQSGDEFPLCLSWLGR